MSDAPLVLSIFPGIGLLDRAFEAEGFTVVRGPDVLWGGDVRTFHPPAGRFDGVIGGPPCQAHSRLRYVNPKAGQKHGDLIPEFCRVVAEAQPEWFLMENVPEAPEPVIDGYQVRSVRLNNRWLDGGEGLGAEQNRLRRFSFGTADGRALPLEVAALEAPEWKHAVTAAGGGRAVPVALQRDRNGGHRPKWALANWGHQTSRNLKEACVLQGLPEDFLDEAPFTLAGKYQVVGNGVPLPMGRAVAQAVKRVIGT
jgi:DNA (cytosine-5)-methyltransferase 1